MAEGWFKFTGSSPYPKLTANKEQSKFTYGNKQNREFRMAWIQGKRDEAKEKMVLDWIERSIGVGFLNSDEAAERLSNGVLLCEFIESLNSHALARKISHKSSRFAATENMENFQDALIALGLNRSQIFPVSDLIEKKDITSLVDTLTILKEVLGY